MNLIYNESVHIVCFRWQRCFKIRNRTTTSFPRLQYISDACTCVLDYEYLSVAQACDRRTAVGLARCHNVDPRFFRRFPKLPDSEVRNKTYVLRCSLLNGFFDARSSIF